MKLLGAIACTLPALLTSSSVFAAEPGATVSASPKHFASAQKAADALVTAAEKFDLPALEEIFGPDSTRVYLSGETPLDHKRAATFASKAHEKQSIEPDPVDPKRAFLMVGPGDWPFPVPLVKGSDGQWTFDAPAGEEELLRRRIGENELDAIGICHGYVEAQHEYAMQVRKGYEVNQYAQRIISTPGKHDGLAWKNADGSWGGPVGEKIAHAIAQGYTNRAEPYHGYYFKILKGQGPAAPLGELDFVVKGLMIGGFALVAAPAEYGVTGIKTFMVSHDGVVYEKDFGEASLQEFQKLERFNPDASWTAVEDKDH
jgi:hypothetical protein